MAKIVQSVLTFSLLMSQGDMVRLSTKEPFLACYWPLNSTLYLDIINISTNVLFILGRHPGYPLLFIPCLLSLLWSGTVFQFSLFFDEPDSFENYWSTLPQDVLQSGSLLPIPG